MTEELSDSEPTTELSNVEPTTDLFVQGTLKLPETRSSKRKLNEIGGEQKKTKKKKYL